MRLSQQIISLAGVIHRTVNQIYNADGALLCVFYLYSPQTGFGTSNRQVWPPLLVSSFSGLSCWTNITGYSVVRCMLSPWDRESGSVQLVTLCNEKFHIILQQISVVTPYHYHIKSHTKCDDIFFLPDFPSQPMKHFRSSIVEANYPSILHMICLLKSCRRNGQNS